MKTALIIAFITVVTAGIIFALYTSVNKGASMLDRWLGEKEEKKDQ